MVKKFVFLFFFLFLLTVSYSKVNAQCAMCKRAAETDMQAKNNTGSAKGLNRGILYLLSVPYLIGAVSAIAWYRNRRRED